MAVAIVALVVAAAGTGYAAQQFDSKDIENNSVKSADLANNKAVKSKDVGADKLNGSDITGLTGGDVTDGSLTGADVGANALSGQQIDEANVGPTDGDTRFAFNLVFGETREVAKIGSFTLTAQCLLNTTDNGGTAARDVGRITLATDTAGSVFRSNDDDKDGSAGANFLNPDTPPGEAVVVEGSAPTGTSLLNDNDDLFAASPNGTRISIPNETTDTGINLFGQNCVFTGHILNLG
jgi:hypothetical protein